MSESEDAEYRSRDDQRVDPLAQHLANRNGQLSEWEGYRDEAREVLDVIDASSSEPRLPATMHEADEQAWAVHDELRSLGVTAASRPLGLMVGAHRFHGMADRLTTARWRPVSGGTS